MTNSEYRKLIQRANARLKRIEQAGKQSPAYFKALDYIERFYNPFENRNETVTRFTSVPEQAPRRRNQQIRAIKRFLNMQTSTLSGIKNAERKRDATFASKGFTGDYNSLYTFLSSAQFDSLSRRYGSDQVVEQFIEMYNEGLQLDEIRTMYDTYLSTQISQDDYLKARQKYEANGFHN